MSRQISRRGGRQVQIGPDVRRIKGPLVAGTAAALLVIDAAYWHLLHHLLGAGSGLVALMAVIVLLGWAWLRFNRKKGR